MMSSLGRDDSYTDRLSIDENGDTVLEIEGERLDLTGGGGGGGEGGGGGQLPPNCHGFHFFHKHV